MNRMRSEINNLRT